MADCRPLLRLILFAFSEGLSLEFGHSLHETGLFDATKATRACGDFGKARAINTNSMLVQYLYSIDLVST